VSSIIKFSIRYAGVIIGLALITVLYGIIQIKNSPLNVFPEFSPTQVIIQTESPGFSADLVENLVTRPIEVMVSGTIGVKQIRSQSIPGLSVVTVIFEENTDIYRNRQSISEKLSTLNNILPSNIIPKITPLTSSASSVLGIGLTSDERDEIEIRTFADNFIIPHLMSIEGVADVNKFGGKIRQFQIQINPEKLYENNITFQDVFDAASKSSAVKGGGFIQNNNQRIIINTIGQAKTLDELENTYITNQKNKTLRLKDVAKIQLGFVPSISSASINGKTGVYLSVQGQLGSDTYELTKKLEKSIESLINIAKKEKIKIHPELFKPANFIDASIKGLRLDIIIGAILVISILYLFLFNFRTAFISAVAIPLSLLSAIGIMSHLNLGLNVMVLSGLAIALGEVVDDAIIDVENIFRRLRENKGKKNPKPVHTIVYESSMEVRKSVVYATLIIVIVFLPLLSLSGVAGKLFGPLGIAYILSILASLVVALTLTPALSYLLLAKGKNIKIEDSPVIKNLKLHYEKILLRIETKSKLVVSSSILMIVFAVSFLPFFKTQFIPPLNEGHYIMHMTAYPGTSELESIRIGNLVSEKIRKIDGVKSVAQWVGRSPLAADTFGTHYSEFEIELSKTSGKDQKRILDSIKELLYNAEKNGFVGVNFAINTFLTERIEETISGYSAAVVVNLYGSNLDALDSDALKIAKVLEDIKGAIDITLQSPPGSPQVSIRLLPEKLIQYGVSRLDALNIIRAAYESLPVTQVYESMLPIDIAVTIGDDFKNDINDIKKLPVQTSLGKIITLDNIAQIYQESGRSKILHQGGKRVQTVTSNIHNRDLNDFIKELKLKINNANLLPGNYFEITGEAQENSKSREDLISHSILAGTSILLMLYIAFGSMRNLLVTVLNLPFALIGGVIAAAFHGGWISIGSLVGFVTLFGITLRNSIMLISHYQHLVDFEGLQWNLQTCIKGASERLPSILMTALVAGLALMPIALGSGEPGKEIEGPMAMIIIGGLFSSTILNLLILPTILLNFGKFEKHKLSEF
jgi:CzcA family heavy metal efflux pump